MSNRILTWHKMPLNICCGMFLKKKKNAVVKRISDTIQTFLTHTSELTISKSFIKKKKKSFQSPLKN